MDPTDDPTIPQYRVIEAAFFQPDGVPVGSIIATHAPPGPHLEPWNDAAVARMEEWYSEEWDEKDPVTKKPTGKKYRPHERYRRAPYTAAAQQTAMIVEPPEAADAVGQSLSELQIRKPTDQRPPAARRFKKTSPVEEKKAAVILKAGPKDNTVTGGPGQ